jgi:hypothetical protein
MTTAVERAARLASRLRALGVDPGEDGAQHQVPYWLAYECPVCASKQRVRQTIQRWDAQPKHLSWRYESANLIRLLSLTVSSRGPGKIENHASPLTDYLADMPRNLRSLNARVVFDFLKRLTTQLEVALPSVGTTERDMRRKLEL